MSAFPPAVMLLLLLAACTGPRGTELPDDDPPGGDRMKLSPCVCLELDYEAPRYRWTG